ncbi:msrB [Lepeophtheirus salmonis]|uniref:Peptide-methionine (R)-S-oxide reductase n=1 Tax=Lepeophtheirus salmonis TaxID=72036 RepID=A0A0K2SV25_LEPSM|nr:peptide methionine sulfoxide reductase MsrB-like [Lepeophtheirus salmonis]CAB4061615.1 msrB [Lepeophtheirus salmonis]CAF2887801.1 msrB [Lepeophtheirus salmonis]
MSILSRTRILCHFLKGPTRPLLLQSLSSSYNNNTTKDPRKMSRSEWKRILEPQIFDVVRNKGTEPPFSSEFNDLKSSGKYLCVCCSQTLFNSEDKYDSGSGWPSFTAPSDDDSVKTLQDKSHGMIRTEVLCHNCGAHLGHVFQDGPSHEKPLRYCINGVALKFDSKF